MAHMKRHFVPVRIWTGVAVATACLALSACSISSDGSSGGGTDASLSPHNPVRVSLGTQAWVGYGPWAIAIKKGLDKANGISIKQTTFNAAQDENSAISAGRLSGGDMGVADWMALLSSGSDAKVVMLEDSSTRADAVLASGNVTSVADLRGKKVAFEDRGIDEALLFKALQDHGMTLKDIQSVLLPTSQAGAALIAGRVSAAAVYEPYISTAIKNNPKVHVLYSGVDAPKLISDVLVLSSDFVKKNPAVVHALVKTWNEAVRAYDSDKTAGEVAIAGWLQTPVADLTTSFNGIELNTRQDSAAAFAKGGTFLTNADTLQSILIAERSLKKPVDYAAHLDASFVSTG
jgi:NitT/TauT family transport system substrate-binding protein